MPFCRLHSAGRLHMEERRWVSPQTTTPYQSRGIGQFLAAAIRQTTERIVRWPSPRLTCFPNGGGRARQDQGWVRLHLLHAPYRIGCSLLSDEQGSKLPCLQAERFSRRAAARPHPKIPHKGYGPDWGWQNPWGTQGLRVSCTFRSTALTVH